MSEFMGQASTITNLRDVFALEAMKFFIENGAATMNTPYFKHDLVGELSYKLADAMIEARKPRDSQNGNP